MIDTEVKKVLRENDALKSELKKSLDELTKLFEQTNEITRKAKGDFRRVVCDEEIPQDKVTDTQDDSEPLRSSTISFSQFAFPPVKSTEPVAKTRAQMAPDPVNLDEVTFFGW